MPDANTPGGCGRACGVGGLPQLPSHPLVWYAFGGAVVRLVRRHVNLTDLGSGAEFGGFGVPLKGR